MKIPEQIRVARPMESKNLLRGTRDEWQGVRAAIGYPV